MRIQESNHVDLQKEICSCSTDNHFFQPHPASSASGCFPIPAFFVPCLQGKSFFRPARAYRIRYHNTHNHCVANCAASHAGSRLGFRISIPARHQGLPCLLPSWVASRAACSTSFIPRATLARGEGERVFPVHGIASVRSCNGMRRFWLNSCAGTVPCLVTIKEIIHGNCQEAGCKKSRTREEGNCSQICSCKKTGSQSCCQARR